MKDFSKPDLLVLQKKTSGIKEFVPPKRGLHESFYCNVAAISASLYDVRFDFGQRGTDNEEHRGDVTLYMSPQHAKEMLVLLVRVLGDYEEDHGPIPCNYNVSASIKPKEKETHSNIPVLKIDNFQ